MPFAVTHSCWQSYRVSHLHSPGQLKIHRTDSNTNSNKMGHHNKHRLYHPNGALRSSILPSITLRHPCTTRKCLPFTYNLASVVQKTGWSSPCQPCSHYLRYPIINYVICRWNHGNTYAGDSTVPWLPFQSHTCSHPLNYLLTCWQCNDSVTRLSPTFRVRVWLHETTFMQGSG